MRAFFLVTSALVLAAACVASRHLLDSASPEPTRSIPDLELERVPVFQDVTEEWSSFPYTYVKPKDERTAKPKSPYYCYAVEDCPRPR